MSTSEATVNLLTAEEIKSEIKPLSSNAFLAFFQRIYRAWLGFWYGFCDKHPKAGKLIGQFVVMFVFSNAVTIWQLLVMLFLPYAFVAIWDVPFIWPAIELPGVFDSQGNQMFYAIFNEPLQFNKEGALIAGGIGNFIAFEIAVFTAQCINFPLQRNITFKSNGNPVIQAIWYFIGWVLISVFTNAVWGIIQPFATAWGWNETIPVVVTLLKTVLTGGVSMLIFFFIFLIIFPDANKVAAKARAKSDAIKASDADPATKAAAELKAVQKEEEARLFNVKTAKYKAVSQANTRAVQFGSVVANAEKAKANATTEEAKAKAAEMEARIPEYQLKASEAIAVKREAVKAYEIAIDEIKAAKTARGEDLSKVY